MNIIRSLIKSFIPVITAVLFIFHGSINADENSPFPIKRVIIYGDGTPGPYTIEQEFIGGSASIDTSFSKAALSVLESDNQSKTVTFNNPLLADDSVAVILAVPPSWIRNQYRRSNEERIQGMTPASTYQTYSEKIPRQFPGLSFGGSKTFDINTGTDRQMALNQTLRLNISGKLTDDITLKAAISDQNIPISPEGDTRELEELDRVLIELKGRNFSADMGDTDLRHDGGRWLSYMRRLSGARASVKAGEFEIFGSGAASEGRHMSIIITPVEGNQGPYRLIAENGQQNISLIPGTEKIWLNGEQLTRGNNYDYTIDYTTGEIIFTERRIIGSDMRIVCDYEYTSESYRRNFYSAGIDGGLFDNRLKLGMVIARESDDSSKPILLSLDDTMREALSETGDSPAVIDGIRPASGDSTGTYDFVEDHLVYNPSEKSKYDVTFSWVGENNGSYRYLGGGIYEFVPPGKRIPGSGASYEPVSVIQGPVSHDLAGINLSYNPVSYIHLETELAGSSVDKNTLSDIDDSDNSSGAHRIGIEISPNINVGVPLKLEFAGNHRLQEQAFSPLDRDRPAEEDRLWGLPLISKPEKEAVTEYSGGISLSDGMFTGSGFSINGGRADFGGITNSKRIGGKGRFALRDRGEANIALNHIIRDNFRGLPDELIDRIYFNANTYIAGFSPKIAFESEQVDGTGDFSHGTAYNDFHSTLKTPKLYGLTGELEWFYRKEQAKQISWSDSSLVRGGSIGFATGQSAAGMLRTQYARRERITGPNLITTDQAIFDCYYRPESGNFRLDSTYRAGRSREASKRKNYLFIGSDRGAYRWEDENGDGIRDQDEFIPDVHGSYYLYEEMLQDYRPVNVVSAYGKLGIDIPAKILQKITGNSIKIQTETTFEINEKSTAPTSDVFLLNLSKFRKKGKTTSGDARIQEDLTIPISGGTGSVRLRYFRFDTYNAEYVTGAERRGEEELSFRLRLPVTEDYDTEYTIKHSLWHRSMEERNVGDYRVRSVAGDAGISFYRISNTKLGINFGGGFDQDKLTTIKANYYTVKPSATYRFSGRGRIEISYAVTSVELENFGRGMRLPHPMAQGQKGGKNHDISVICDYRLSNRMNLIATYTGRKFGGQKFENFARAQIRALF